MSVCEKHAYEGTRCPDCIAGPLGMARCEEHLLLEPCPRCEFEARLTRAGVRVTPDTESYGPTDPRRYGLPTSKQRRPHQIEEDIEIVERNNWR